MVLPLFVSEPQVVSIDGAKRLLPSVGSMLPTDIDPSFPAGAFVLPSLIQLASLGSIRAIADVK
jgi:hypothetical protein